MHKDFAIKLASMLKDSGIKDTCLNFMHDHPEMFSDTISGNSKVMNINMSVAIVCKEDEIKADPGFIVIDVGSDNNYSEHYECNSKYWNHKLEEDIAIQK